MKIVDKIASQIIVNREINREGEFAFRTHQRSMSSTKQHLIDSRDSMLQTETYRSTEAFRPIGADKTTEIRNMVLIDKGIFQKIIYLSGSRDEYVYNMLLTSGSFIQVTIEKGEIKSIILQDEYGIYRELHTYPKKTKSKVLRFVCEVTELLDKMLKEEKLPND
jgi:hypothetical protein